MSVTISEAAARHVTRYLAKRGKGVGVRLGVKTTGCSGLAYKLEYADDVVRNVKASDKTLKAVQAFLTPGALVELTLTIGYYMMVCRFLESMGQVVVTARDTKAPLPKAYVKVFARLPNGAVRFHKDGYTDLRGKFDYLSHTGIDPSTVKRVAVLVSHPDQGARTVIYDR